MSRSGFAAPQKAWKRFTAILGAVGITSSTVAAITIGAVAVTSLNAPAASAASSFVSEFQPTVPTKYGGRSISVSLNASNPNQVIVATESGGLFRSNND